MKVVLITGAASGLGWALAQACYQRGDALVMTDRNAPGLADRQRELDDDDRVLALAGDITQSRLHGELLSATAETFGRLDILINNAGITHRSPAADTSAEVLRQVMDIDWLAPALLANQALPLLRQSRGQVINIGSMAGWMPVPGRAAYCAAKSALAQYFEVWRLEQQQQGISVLMAYPSFLDTPIERNALAGDGQPAQHARSTVGTLRSAHWMASRILAASEAGQPWLYGDGISLFGSLLWRIWPALYLRLIRRRFADELARA